MVAAASVVKDIPDWDTAIFESMRELGRIVPSDAKQDGGCRTTFNPDTLEEAFAVLANAAKLLLVSKQEKYGKDNILTFCAKVSEIRCMSFSLFSPVLPSLRVEILAESRGICSAVYFVLSIKSVQATSSRLEYSSPRGLNETCLCDCFSIVITYTTTHGRARSGKVNQPFSKAIPSIA